MFFFPSVISECFLLTLFLGDQVIYSHHGDLAEQQYAFTALQCKLDDSARQNQALRIQLGMFALLYLLRCQYYVSLFFLRSYLVYLYWVLFWLSSAW